MQRAVPCAPTVIVLGVVAILCCGSSATASGSPKQVGYPSSIAAIGDSWETGYATNPAGGGDARENSWVTGTNPVVNSFYERILAANPKIKGRMRNAAGDGETSGEFSFQAGVLTGIHLDLIVEALGSNDLCGTAPLKPQFGINMGAGIRQLALEHPDARILMVGIGGTRALWEAAGATIQTRGGASFGACDPKYDADGKPSPAQLAWLKQRETAYNGVLQSICTRYVHCRYDAGMNAFDLQVSDLALWDSGHPGPSGAAKIAAAVWANGFDFNDRSAPISQAHRSHGTVTMTATDPQGVSGIEWRTNPRHAWRRYTQPVALVSGQTLTWRAVDVNGNIEASHSLKG